MMIDPHPAPDPRMHACEIPGCDKFGPLGHHEKRRDQVIEHWRCKDHRHENGDYAFNVPRIK